MIEAQIVIRMRSQLYRYVRDVVADSYGKDGLYYSYRGNARRKLNLSQRNIPSSKETGLKRGTVYSFRVGVNGGDVKEYTLSFQGDEREPITYFQLMHFINNKSDEFELVWEDYNREEEGFYFVAGGMQAATSIDVEDGTGDNPLFANLDLFESIGDEIASDNFFDQTDAGQIKADFDAISDSMENEENYFIEFPESDGPTELLVRENSESPRAHVFNKIARHVAENLQVVEVTKNVRKSF